jgi:hypothetical protein
MKKTTVEWLECELKKIPFVKVEDVIKMAKAMEKEHNEYFFNCGRNYQLTGEGTFTETYNETYGK